MSAGRSGCRRPLHLVFMPVPCKRGAVFVVNLQVAVPSMAFVQGAGLAVMRAKASEQACHLGEQCCVVHWRRAGQGIPVLGAVCVFVLVEIEKLQCHDCWFCKTQLSQGPQHVCLGEPAAKGRAGIQKILDCLINGQNRLYQRFFVYIIPISVPNPLVQCLLCRFDHARC